MEVKPIRETVDLECYSCRGKRADWSWRLILRASYVIEG